jgi:hypothetical protein
MSQNQILIVWKNQKIGDKTDFLKMNNNKTPKMSRVNVLRRPSCNAALFTRHNICNSKHDLWNTLSIPIRKKQSVSIFGTPRI